MIKRPSIVTEDGKAKFGSAWIVFAPLVRLVNQRGFEVHSVTTMPSRLRNCSILARPWSSSWGAVAVNVTPLSEVGRVRARIRMSVLSRLNFVVSLISLSVIRREDPGVTLLKKSLRRTEVVAILLPIDHDTSADTPGGPASSRRTMMMMKRPKIRECIDVALTARARFAIATVPGSRSR